MAVADFLKYSTRVPNVTIIHTRANGRNCESVVRFERELSAKVLWVCITLLQRAFNEYN